EGREYPLFERIQVRKDGTKFPVELNVSLIRDPEGKPLYIQSLVRDITKRKKNEDILNRSLKEKVVLLKEIHHRVKNNMQIISSLLRLKASSLSEKGVEKIFQESQDQIRSMALVHEQLYESKDLSRIDFARYVQKLVNNLQSSYEGMAAVEIVLALESIKIDVNRAIPCGLILNELVTNAYEHAFPEGRGRLIVGLNRTPDGMIHMEVSDDGRGLPENLDLNTISSLGLTLVRDLTLQLDGRFDFSSGEGSRFEVSFP
ncbi:MAG: PAS domain S-box protein, partial [Candidatus Aminicenantes bacterium]|nr:PAS domain S-box protein [Candidatus Aminicenantes bacterium]